MTVGRRVDDLPAAADDGEPPGQAAVVDVAREVPVDPGQPLGVEPEGRWIDLDLWSTHHAEPCSQTPTIPR